MKKKNQILMINNIDGDGQLVNEGSAKLIKKLDSDSVTGKERWRVKFLSDGFIADRWV